MITPSTHQYVLEESYPVSITSPPDHRIDGSLVFDNLSSNRFRDFGGNPMVDPMLPHHFLQYDISDFYDISQEGVQKLRNAGVCRLSDFHYIQSSDVRNMNMSVLDQRKTEKMLESWHAMHQDVLRGDDQQPQAPPTPGNPEQPFFDNIPWLWWRNHGPLAGGTGGAAASSRS